MMDATTTTPLDLPALIETYLARCVIEGKSPRTVRAYRETLGRFVRCLQEDGAPLDPDAVRPDHVIAYLVRYAQHSPDTRHRYFREVRCFCTWLRAAGYTENDPFRGLRNVGLPQKIVPPFTPAEIQTLLARCNEGTSVGSRDQALLLTLLDTGVRCAEAVALDLDDCDFATRRLHVRHGKGDKARVVPFAARCADALSTYLLDRGTEPGPLFLSARYGRLHPGVRLGVNGLKIRLRTLGREAGIPKVHAHRFRHTFATWAIAHDARELDVQHLLGHSSPDMVRRYSATYRSAQAAERHHAFSPGDQMLAGIPDLRS
ncbi:MAG: integrase/recombinase XerC/integrase/recombinase XerD [Chloroflexi bacterium]|nr:MAG: integrase/recombinase XerC/integrase/recombinase XerD [Chloroflexota bacterium]